MTRVKLSDTVKPSHYDLDLRVESESFKGTVDISLNAKEPVESFELNSKNLEILELKIMQGKKQIKANFEVSRPEFIRVNLGSKVEGNFKLTFVYEGKYGTLDGFYKSSYNGKDLFSTLFEATYARKAFPCFDEPEMKATFSLKITCLKNLTALGNGQVLSVEENDDYKTVTFEKTPKMSTYILAWVVGEMDFIEKKDKKVTVRLYADKNELEWGRYSLEVAFEALKFYENYFGIPYPLSKLDLVTIPSFSCGAMENWGLITFRKTSLLWDPKSSFLDFKKNLTTTVVHELAHMWFGNLVTMTWWNDLWLNEGFAVWAATFAISNHSMIEWNEDSYFCTRMITGGLLADSLQNTHKIAVEVNDPNEIDQIFDAISYLKGASVIRMLQTWMGDNFQVGIQNYLKSKAYGNAETKDLWEFLESAKTGETSKKPNQTELTIAELMSEWVDRPGYPYIVVKEEGDSIVLTQHRFTKGYSLEDKPWPIPLSVRWLGSSEEVEKIMMYEKEIVIKRKAELFKLNDSMNSFIRVLYPADLLSRLMKTNISKVDLLNLVNDACEFAFTLRSDFPFTEFSEMKEETSYDVVFAVLNNLGAVKSIFYDDELISQKITEIENSFIKDRLSKINLKNPSKNINDLALEAFYVSLGVQNGLIEINDENVHQEFKQSYFVSQANKDFGGVKKFYETSTLPGVKESALIALGKTKQESDYVSVLEDFSFILPHDILHFSFSFGDNSKFRNLYAKQVMKNFKAMEDHVSDDGLFRHVIKGAFSQIYQDDLMVEVLEFLTQLQKDENNAKYERVILGVKDNLQTMKAFRDKVKGSLRKQFST